MLNTKFATTTSRWVAGQRDLSPTLSQGGPLLKRPRGLKQRIAIPYSFTSKGFDANPFDPLQYLTVSKLQNSSGSSQPKIQVPSAKMTTSNRHFGLTSLGLSKNMTKRSQFEPEDQIVQEKRWVPPVLAYDHGGENMVTPLQVQGNQVKQLLPASSLTSPMAKPSYRVRNSGGLVGTQPAKKLIGPGPHPMPHLPTTSFSKLKSRHSAQYLKSSSVLKTPNPAPKRISKQPASKPLNISQQPKPTEILPSTPPKADSDRVAKIVLEMVH